MVVMYAGKSSEEWYNPDGSVSVMTKRDGKVEKVTDVNGTLSVEEREHNARFIAIAPKMLAALEEVTEWMRAHTGPADGTHDMLCRAVDTINAAGGTVR